MMRRGPIIAAVAGVAVILLMVVALILPKASQISAKQKEVAAAQEQEQALQLQLQQLQADEKDAPQSRKQLDKLNQQMPPTADLPGLIKTLDSTADKVGVDFISLTPQTPTTVGTGDFSIVPLQVTVVGGFFAIDQFLYEVEGLQRISKVMTLSLTAGPDGLPQLQAVAQIEFYTTDVSAGPGSEPGHTDASGTTSGTSAPAGAGATPTPNTSGTGGPPAPAPTGVSGS
jgi:Tfp pilus assembly protein PilO